MANALSTADLAVLLIGASKGLLTEARHHSFIVWFRMAAPWPIIVDIGERAWCQLAYQFGHELGQSMQQLATTC